jgi:hypothetical protein
LPQRAREEKGRNEMKKPEVENTKENPLQKTLMESDK